MQLRSCHILRKCLTFVKMNVWLRSQRTHTRARAHAHTHTQPKGIGMTVVAMLESCMPSHSHQCQAYAHCLVPTGTESDCALCSCPRSNEAATKLMASSSAFRSRTHSRADRGRARPQTEQQKSISTKANRQQQIARTQKSIAPEKPLEKKHIISLNQEPTTTRIYAILCGHFSHAKLKVSTHIETHALQSTTTKNKERQTTKHTKTKLMRLLLPADCKVAIIYKSTVLIIRLKLLHFCPAKGGGKVKCPKTLRPATHNRFRCKHGASNTQKAAAEKSLKIQRWTRFESNPNYER